MAWNPVANIKGPAGADAGSDASTILNGIGAPTAAIGEDGDYYLDTAADVLYGPKGAAAGAPQERMLDNTAPSSSAAGNYTVGNKFTVNADGQITHIRYFHAAGCGGIPHQLSLWNGNTGAKLATVADVAPSAFYGYREIALPAPLHVAAGDVLVVSYQAGGGTFLYSTSTPASLAPHLTFGSPAGCYTGGATEAFPSTSAGAVNYNADVVYVAGTSGGSVWPIALVSDQGGTDKNFVYTQTAPAATWSVAHGLNKYPAVEIVDSGGSAIIPSIHYDDANSVTLSFGGATSGKAYFN